MYMNLYLEVMQRVTGIEQCRIAQDILGDNPSPLCSFHHHFAVCFVHQSCFFDPLLSIFFCLFMFLVVASLCFIYFFFSPTIFERICTRENRKMQEKNQNRQEGEGSLDKEQGRK